MITRTMCRIALGLTIGAVAAPDGVAGQEIETVTCDGGSCRQPLELMNGRSVTIRLAGRGLDALASGVVTAKSGRRIQGVNVELAPPGRPSRTRDATTTRDVTVTAQGIAAARTGLELRFTTNARGTVTAPLELSIAAAEQTRITRVSAETVRVEAGGAAVPLTVDGVNLAAVTSARVLLDGRPISDLASELATPARSTTDQPGGQLVVELAAGPSVPAGDYQLELMAGRQRIVVPGTISVVDVLRASAPSVSAATPASLELVADGAIQSVVLQGEKLDQANAVHVERDGVRLHNVPAQLLPTTNPARREVRMRADASAGPPWGVPLELVLNSGVGGTKVPLHLVVTEPPKVDLLVSACSFEQFPQLTLARATIRNTGSEGASFQTNKPMARVGGFDRYATVNAPGGGIYIAPGATAEIDAQLWTVPGPGSHTVIWTVDPLDLIPESNPANNEKTCTHVVESAPPPPATYGDLIIREIDHEPHSGPPGTTFKFTVIVENNSPVHMGNRGIAVRCRINGASFEGNSLVRFGDTAAGEQKTYELETSANFAPGTKTLECTVDPSNELSESNEDNNKNAIWFVVTS